MVHANIIGATEMARSILACRGQAQMVSRVTQTTSQFLYTVIP